MTTNRDFDRIATGWLAEGPTELNDRVLNAALDEVHLTHRRRRPAVPWRIPTLSTPLRFAAAIVVVVSVGLAGFNLVGSRGIGGSPSPSASPTISATPAAPAATPIDPTTWKPFSSTRYGYTAAAPAEWSTLGAERDWATESEAEMWASPDNAPWTDRFFVTQGGGYLVITGVRVVPPSGVSEQAFLDAYMAPLPDPSSAPGASPACRSTVAAMTPITVDGKAGRLSTTCGTDTVFVPVGGRIYVFSISDPTAYATLNAFLSTVRLPAG